MPRANKVKAKGDQHAAFKALARELDCDESVEAFERTLKKIGKSGPVAKPKRKVRKPLKLAL